MAGFGQPSDRKRPATAAERVAAAVARHSIVERGEECADWSRRRRLERNPIAWLRWYLAASYTRPFDRPHREIVSGVTHAHATGGRFAVAAERGVGKSVILWGVVLYLSLTGRCRFPAYLPWSAAPMKRGLSFWRSALSFNERILADYRWIAAPFAHARGCPQRMHAQRWSHNGEPCGALLQVGDGLIVLPDNRGAIGGSSVNGNPRGLNLPQTDGSVLRPDLAVVDDPQDRKVASSLQMVDQTCDKIDADIGGLGEAGAAFPLLLSGNCIASGDVMERYLADPLWKPLRVSCVEQWPDGWADKGPAYHRWAEWWDEYRHDARAGAKFFRLYRKTLTAGMRLSAPHAYAARVDATLPDARCVAMRQYWQMGHEAFTAERQQTPLSPDAQAPFALTVPLILSREDETRGWHEQPAGIRIVATVASTDINDYGLSTVVLGFANDQTAAVLWYGLFAPGGYPIMDPGTPEAEKVGRLYDALCQHGDELAAMASGPSVWAIDAGYLGQVVRRYADTAGRKVGMSVLLCKGMPSDKYRPGFRAIGRPCEGCHLTEFPTLGRALAWQADSWKEIAQKAWLGQAGKPGSVSLPRGDHREIAEQIWRERLLGRGVVGGRETWAFARTPGRHDFGDAMAQAYAAAAYGGIGTGGQAVVSRRRMARRGGVSVVEM